MSADVTNLVLGVLTGIVSSSLFILALFIGFCVLLGFTKTKKTAGGNIPVIKSLDETISHKAMVYLPPTAPRGHADPLKVW
jgi:acid phosphatase family membrane protein YuiD